jgi:hypothetical protein
VVSRPCPPRVALFFRVLPRTVADHAPRKCAHASPQSLPQRAEVPYHAGLASIVASRRFPCLGLLAAVKGRRSLCVADEAHHALGHLGRLPALRTASRSAIAQRISGCRHARGEAPRRPALGPVCQPAPPLAPALAAGCPFGNGHQCHPIRRHRLPGRQPEPSVPPLHDATEAGEGAKSRAANDPIGCGITDYSAVRGE